MWCTNEKRFGTTHLTRFKEFNTTYIENLNNIIHSQNYLTTIVKLNTITPNFLFFSMTFELSTLK